MFLFVHRPATADELRPGPSAQQDGLADMVQTQPHRNSHIPQMHTDHRAPNIQPRMSLTALALLVSYVNIVQTKTTEVLNFNLTSPTVLVGLFIGAMLTFVFSAFTMSAVQRAAQSIVVEVRRQFREIAGIMEGTADPDYATCVALCTKGALHEMVIPALLAIIVPLATGIVLCPTGVVGLLGGVSVTGFAMAVFMSNAGGAWDNAKKYIESGHHGGKGSECHKAAVVGDTVGDPFKDTSGPSLNILIKLCSTVSIVFSGLIVAFNLMNLL